ncbi:MAG: radical SAM protein [Candidatus Omnitrophica bacterium]|nr:radical SAM protein [Candidatus Omnitrophota bacterium]
MLYRSKKEPGFVRTLMEVLIIKYYEYKPVMSDDRFSPDIAFRRLNGVLEIARQVLPDSKKSILVPGQELEAASKHVRLMANETIYKITEAPLSKNIFSGDNQMLVFDEQGFYASPGLVRSVMETAAGRAGTWRDPQGLAASFNYSSSCRFFIAPSLLVRKHLYGVGDFQYLQDVVLKEAGGVFYTIKPDDMPEIYKQAIKFNPFPYHYCLEPTSRCNSECIMCPFHSPDPDIAKGRVYLGKGGDDMPLGMFKGLVDEIASIGWNYLPHYRFPQVTVQLRGEPLIAPYCREMFAYVKERDLRLSFSTNGALLGDDGLMDFLIDIGTDEVIVSIDGTEKEYARIRPSLDYKKVVENLKMLRKLRDRRKSSVPVLYAKRVHLRDSTKEDDEKFIEYFSSIADSVGVCFENYDDPEHEVKHFTGYHFDVDDRDRLPCIFVSDVCAVKADGNVDICYSGQGHFQGNVREKKMLDILRDNPLRNRILDGNSKGVFNNAPFCSHCASWKGNYNRYEEMGVYKIAANPFLSYWKRED